jgi:hypothetical protein
MKKRPIPEYEKTNPIDDLFSAKKIQPHKQGFYSYLKEIYPRVISQQKLTNWQSTAKKNSIVPEPFLFIAIMCGAHFRIKDSEDIVKETLTSLYDWFAWGDDRRRMKPEIAKLVVNALAPGIRSQIEGAGHVRGWPDGSHFRKKGPPIDMRGAWVAALVIENYLRQKDNNSRIAKKQTLDFIAILLGHKAEESVVAEFNRYYKNAPKAIITDLTNELMAEYKFMMKQDGVIASDFVPSEKHKKKYTKWESRHKSLKHEIKAYGWEELCRSVISRITTTLWEPLWNIKFNYTDGEKEKE